MQRRQVFMRSETSRTSLKDNNTMATTNDSRDKRERTNPGKNAPTMKTIEGERIPDILYQQANNAK
jgi:hypothetical protein